MKMIKPLKKRGVSPVIATVLLIGIVIVIGLIIFLWLRGLTQEAVVKFDKNVELVCEDVEFDADYSGGKLTVSNIGNIALYEIKIKIIRDASFETKSISELVSEWPASGLNPGRIFSENVDLNAKSIVIIPVLIGSSESGEQSYICDEVRFGNEITL